MVMGGGEGLYYHTELGHVMALHRACCETGTQDNLYSSTRPNAASQVHRNKKNHHPQQGKKHTL